MMVDIFGPSRPPNNKQVSVIPKPVMLPQLFGLVDQASKPRRGSHVLVGSAGSFFSRIEAERCDLHDPKTCSR